MKKLSQLFLLLAMLAGVGVFSSCNNDGCTDPLAGNYDPDAKNDDGSCLYDNKPGVILSDNGSGIGTRTLSADTTYFLEGFVFVNSGQTLTIPAGTVIKGRQGTGADASALIVARGGMINATGTATNPIIFTSELDDVTDPTDIPAGTRGLWGGVIILGSAGLNSSPGETAIEGIPVTETRGLYGGTDDADNSGTFQYVSIRYGGSDIGAGNEINGLTMGGVGSGTTIDHVEVVFNQDDGFEFFGGTVNTKYLCAAFCGDDSYDYDEGFRGKGQFWFMIGGTDEGDRGGEHDGGTDPEDGSPYAIPTIYNATYIGRGEAEGKRALTFRDNAGGHYMNSVFVDWGKGVDIELLASGTSSWDRGGDSELSVEDCVFYNVAGNDTASIFKVSLGSGVDPTDSATATATMMAAFNDWGNEILDPGMSISRSADGGLNPVPTAAGVTSGATPATDAWFTSVTYKGAFGTDNWLSGWTLLDEAGYLP